MKFLKQYSLILALALMLSIVPVASATEIALSQEATWYVTDVGDISSLTAAPLYDVADGRLTAGIARMPEDVTAEYAGNALYGIASTETRGRAFRIILEAGVYFEDGTILKAQDLASALRERLADYPWIAGGADFLQGGEKLAQQVISLKAAGFDTVSAAKEAGYTRFYMDLAHFWGLEAGWEPVDSRNRINDYAMPGGLDEKYVTPAYLYRNYLTEGATLSYMHSRYVGVAETVEKMTLEDVGILETGDEALIIITSEAMTARTLAARLASLELEGLWGPYRIVTWDADEILLERNEFWLKDAEKYPAQTIRCYPR